MKNMMEKPLPLINELAHALTNRKEFPGDVIIHDRRFDPEEQAQIWYALQSSLFLDKDNTDQYILIALSLMNAHQNVINTFHNPKLEFEVTRPVDKTVIENGSFVTIGSRIGGVKACGIMPIPSFYDIAYDTEDSVKITTDIGKTYLQKSKSFDYDKGGSVLAIDWPEKVPFKGPIRSFDEWNPGFSIKINHRPISIDYKEWLRHVEISVDIIKLLIPLGFAEEYTTSQSNAEKLALLVLTLAVSNTSIK